MAADTSAVQNFNLKVNEPVNWRLINLNTEKNNRTPIYPLAGLQMSILESQYNGSSCLRGLLKNYFVYDETDILINLNNEKPIKECLKSEKAVNFKIF